MLNYLCFRTACDATFGLFLVTWFVTRHVIYTYVCKSIIVDVPKVMPVGCYNSDTGKLVSTDGGSSVLANVLQPFNDPQGLVCFNHVIQYGFFALLSALQVLTLIWFGMVLGVAYRVLTGKGAQDSRSDDEADEEEGDVYFTDDDVSLHTDSGSEKTVQLAKAVGDMDNKSATVPVNMVKERSASPATTAGSSRTRRPARTTAISLPGHGDRKDLLGRIGCDKPT
jgi:very-long-chain ceramide synthase